jgi:hypothetical protein
MEPTFYLDQVTSKDGQAHAFEYVVGQNDRTWHDCNYVYVTSDLTKDEAEVLATKFATYFLAYEGEDVAFVVLYSYDEIEIYQSETF